MKLLKNTAQNRTLAVQILKQGGIIAHPADTCYGLAGGLMNKAALKKVQAIKGRDFKKPMSIMLPAFMKEEIRGYVMLDEFTQKVVDKLLPGPVTLVLPKGSKIPSWFFPELTTVGLRMPADESTQDLLAQFGEPLITTSANPSGKPTCSNSEEVLKSFEHSKNQPDLILEGELPGDCLPSTVLLVKDREVEVLREGPLTKKKIQAALGLNLS